MSDRHAIETFPELESLPGLVHGFIVRQAGVEVTTDREGTLERLQPGFDVSISELGLERERLARAEQVHGGVVAMVSDSGISAGADGLITNTPSLALGIVVADCCAVYIVDPIKRAIGLVHSGKKGTEANISGTAIRQMSAAYGSSPRDLLVRLSPCIRPPAYEVDIAAQIREQVRQAGVPESSIHDDGTCTTSDLDRFYSYRAEKGATGRMLALLAL
ncbi:MAG: copper oxidase (laccase) domain-containing protein [Pseudoalteromonas tetraodonis]|jgi:copper oxidase (laccase) domain-containing protein